MTPPIRSRALVGYEATYPAACEACPDLDHRRMRCAGTLRELYACDVYAGWSLEVVQGLECPVRRRSRERREREED